MPKSKAAKRAARKKRNAERASLLVPLGPMKHAATTRGRPKTNRDIGPTPQTAAKLKSDTIHLLRTIRVEGAPFLDADLAEAGEEVLRAWKLITAPVDHKSGGAGSGVDRPASERLQAIWRRWCGLPADNGPGELSRRLHIQPSVVVNMLQDSDAVRMADGTLDPGAGGLLKRALEWWRMAARDVGRARA